MKHRSALFGLTAVLLGCAALAASADDGVANGVAINPNYSPDIEKIQEGVSDVQAGQNSNDPDEVLEGVGDIIGGLGLGTIVNCAPPQSGAGANTAQSPAVGVPTSKLSLPLGNVANTASQAASQAAGQASNLVRNHTSH